MLVWHLGNGHATSFGKMIDERLLPNVFGTGRLNSSFRHKPPYNSEPFDNIDHVVQRADGLYLMSLKASGWTIQLGQAMNLYKDFKQLTDEHLDGNGLNAKGIIVGVFYGHKGLLTDKYKIVQGVNRRRQNSLTPLAKVDVKAGALFWSWLNDDEPRTQDWIIEGIQQGTREFSENNPETRALVGGAAKQLVDALRKKYGLPGDGSIDWSLLLHAINDDQGKEIGEEAVEVSSTEAE